MNFYVSRFSIKYSLNTFYFYFLLFVFMDFKNRKYQNCRDKIKLNGMKMKMKMDVKIEKDQNYLKCSYFPNSWVVLAGISQMEAL